MSTEPVSQPASQPQSLVERILTEIWNTSLGRTDLGPDHNFFDHGGDSLLALVTIEQINQRLGWKLDLGDLLRYPNVRALAAHKALPQAANTERALVRMSNRGSRTPIVFVHAVSGMVFAYAKLVQSLGADRGCYGIQSSLLVDSDSDGDGGSSDGDGPAETIASLADRYVDLIADELGEDAFHLAGWSAGGAIAFEIARRAAARGLDLQRLILVDSYVWQASPFETSDEAALREFRTDMLAQVFADGGELATAAPSGSQAAVFEELAGAMFGATALRSTDAGLRFVERMYRAYRSNLRALASYRPAPAPVAALLLHGAENDTLETWRDVLRGGLTAEATTADHYGLLREHDAANLAARIEAYCTGEAE